MSMELLKKHLKDNGGSYYLAVNIADKIGFFTKNITRDELIAKIKNAIEENVSE